MKVSPVTMVYLLKCKIKYQVIRQLSNTVHSRSKPKLAPAFDIAVTLPVPMLYPIIKIPGMMLAIKVLSLVLKLIPLVLKSATNGLVPA
jgi:hypothetical protein